MDRNSIIGLVLISLLIIVYTIYTKPSAEQVRAQKERQDSIAKVEEQKNLPPTAMAVAQDTIPVNDSLIAQENKEQLGDFSSGASGTEQLVTLENNLIKVVITSKGGKIKRAELKNY